MKKIRFRFPWDRPSCTPNFNGWNEVPRSRPVASSLLFQHSRRCKNYKQFRRVAPSEAQWSKVLSDTDYQRGHNFWRSIPRLEYLLPAAAGLLILVLLTHPEAAWVVGLAIVAAVILPYAVSYTSRHVSGLLIVLMLIELIAASIFATSSDHKIGAIIRYPLNLFVRPSVYSRPLEIRNSAPRWIS